MKELTSTSDSYLAFLTGSKTKYPFTEKPNFRILINPEYKANRKDATAPVHLDSCRKFLIDEWCAIVTEGYEADDALGFRQTNETTIFSIDKDLLMIPGCHYNFVRKEYTEVTELEGLKSFYRSMLVGDTSDNIIGVKGIGKVKAAKIIDPLETELDMFDAVYDLYSDNIERFWMNANCLWIMRKEGELYKDRTNFLKELNGTKTLD